MDLQLQLELGNQKPEVSPIQHLPWETGVGGGSSGKCVELSAREVSWGSERAWGIEANAPSPVPEQEPGAVYLPSLMWVGGGVWGLAAGAAT